jgi:hypothetical protein
MTDTNRPVVEEANGAHPYPGTTAEDFIKRASQETEKQVEESNE